MSDTTFDIAKGIQIARNKACPMWDLNPSSVQRYDNGALVPTMNPIQANCGTCIKHTCMDDPGPPCNEWANYPKELCYSDP